MVLIHRSAATKAAAALLCLLQPIGPAMADGGHAAEIGHAGSPGAASRTIEITMLDNYFAPESISVRGGETVRFVVVNRGVFLHEFNIGTALMHAEHQAEMLVMFEHGMIEADHINHEMMQMDMGGQTMAHDDPNSVLVEPGKTAEITWTFPADGDLEFACNVPGHYQVGMVGSVDIGS